MNYSNDDLGWNDQWQAAWDSEPNLIKLQPARVITDYGLTQQVLIDGAPRTAESSGAMRHTTNNPDLPKIGDWVGIEEKHGAVSIHAVLPRQSTLTRKSAGRRIEHQVLACNVDLALVVQSMDDDLNPNRLQRYLFQLQKSHISAVIVINKIDKDPDWKAKVDHITSLLPDYTIIAIEAHSKKSIAQIQSILAPRKTTVILGSSRVGKSTILNGLLGEKRQETQSVRKDDAKGRHTTTHRELFVLPNGALLIDTPGIRELQLWGTNDDIANLDTKISTIAQNCKFKNCSHIKEQDCAVRQAIADGIIEQANLDSFHKLKSELEFLNSKVDIEGKLTYKNKQKKLHKMYRSTLKGKQKRK